MAYRQTVCATNDLDIRLSVVAAQAPRLLADLRLERALPVLGAGVRRVERVTIIGDVPYYDASQEPTEAPDDPFRGVIKRWTRS